MAGGTVSDAPVTEHVETAGVSGNARLTAVTGLLLIGLLFVEGITILEIRGLITLHVFIGLVLIGPVLLKCASTIYRFSRYYAGSPPYVRKGPPPLLLRVLGPLVILSTLTVVGTGAGLLAVTPEHAGLLLLAHKAGFVAWFALMALHVLGHLREAAVDSLQELRPRGTSAGSQGRPLRAAAIVASLMLGVAVAAGFTPTATAWTNHARLAHDHR